MANPLHDNARSKADKPKDKADDKKPEAGGDEKAAIEKKATEKPAGESNGPGEGIMKKPSEDKPVADAGDEGASKKDMFMDGMKAIQKRHESERRDMHGNHREALRQTASRHGKEIADHFDLHFGQGETPAAAPAGGAAAEPAEEA